MKVCDLIKQLEQILDDDGDVPLVGGPDNAPIRAVYLLDNPEPANSDDSTRKPPRVLLSTKRPN